ncbi:uncharacterized protein LOC144219855 [Crocuta crocuta]
MQRSFSELSTLPSTSPGAPKRADSSNSFLGIICESRSMKEAGFSPLDGGQNDANLWKTLTYSQGDLHEACHHQPRSSYEQNSRLRAPDDPDREKEGERENSRKV